MVSEEKLANYITEFYTIGEIRFIPLLRNTLYGVTPEYMDGRIFTYANIYSYLKILGHEEPAQLIQVSDD